MLNRRYLRVKVMQALYAYFKDPKLDLPLAEKNMLKSINGIYDLYILMLSLLLEVRDAAEAAMDLAKEKRLPTAEDLNPNRRFVDHRLLMALENNGFLKKQIDNTKATWGNEAELVRKTLRLVKETPEFEEFMAQEENSFEADKKFLTAVYKKYIGNFELIHHLLEETNIHWYDDIVLVNISVVKTLNNMRPNATESERMLLSLYKDKEDDLQFVKGLFRKTVVDNGKYEEMIGEKTKNWEVDRIATMDVLLMKMALCELEHFSSIPVKVTLNEYIELSKNYSTPKSKVFINGVLDKIVSELKASKQLKKTGRGLIE